MRVEASEIKGRLLDSLTTLLDRYFPGWKKGKSGRKAYLAPSKSDLGSFELHLAGPKKGGWVRYSSGESGDVIDLLSVALGRGARDRAAAFAEARDFLGLGNERDDSPDAAIRREQRRLAAARAAERREAEERADALARQAAADGAVGVWRGAAPAGTMVARYLAGRGIDMPVPPTVRELACCHHAETRTWHPAMCALVQDGVTRAPLGIHLTYLNETATGVVKAAVKPAKRMRGATFGGHVRLGPVPPDGVLVVAEGIETALSVTVASGLTCWAALSLGNLGAALPEGAHAVILAVDMDEAMRAYTVAEAGALRRVHPETLVAKAVAEHAARGLEVRVARPPKGMDFNAWLQRQLAEAEGV
ncbi:Toprim domain-containing protein [Pseudoxanthobacter soli DSM 19599]|uniref:Toprim domain-containing protein n=1 Tax=Pseudoxanthobacter soli DSM 19599 TaxID=1123029 RepID=A0A1M7ZLR3_9HYPH|nr:Toprim domain-containing protein [Pseudoxanthobacter soli DSM 19599]